MKPKKVKRTGLNKKEEHPNLIEPSESEKKASEMQFLRRMIFEWGETSERYFGLVEYFSRPRILTDREAYQILTVGGIAKARISDAATIARQLEKSEWEKMSFRRAVEVARTKRMGLTELQRKRARALNQLAKLLLEMELEEIAVETLGKKGNAVYQITVKKLH